MSCELADSLLHGYFDGELNPVRAAELERHLSRCTGCATALADLDFQGIRGYLSDVVIGIGNRGAQHERCLRSPCA